MSKINYREIETKNLLALVLIMFNQLSCWKEVMWLQGYRFSSETVDINPTCETKDFIRFHYSFLQCLMQFYTIKLITFSNFGRSIWRRSSLLLIKTIESTLFSKVYTISSFLFMIITPKQGCNTAVKLIRRIY